MSDRTGATAPDPPARAAGLAALAEAVAGAVAGCGRTVAGGAWLADEAAARARGAGLDVLRTRGSEAERSLPFGVARRLFLPALERLDDTARASVLDGAGALAAPVLEPVPRGPRFAGALAVVHGLYWVAANLADRRPLALVVDDAQCVDEPTARLFRYLAQRIDELPVVLVLASR